MGMNRGIERKGAMVQRRKEEKPRQSEFPLRPLHLCAFAFFFFFFLPPVCRRVRAIRDRISEILYLALFFQKLQDFVRGGARGRVLVEAAHHHLLEDLWQMVISR